MYWYIAKVPFYYTILRLFFKNIKSKNLNLMKSKTKYLFFSLCLAFSVKNVAQKPPAPLKLDASDAKFTNLIQVTWEGTTNEYRIYRTAPNTPPLLDTVRGTRYSDRRDLKPNIKYKYQVKAVLNGILSDGSNEDLGSILVVAERKSKPAPEPIQCLTITVTQSEVIGQNFILNFLAASKCNRTKQVQLMLYHSDDNRLDEATDPLLTQETFLLTRTRGRFFPKLNGIPSSGFLILKIISEVDSQIIVKEITKK
jgi:hypothetical protein